MSNIDLRMPVAALNLPASKKDRIIAAKAIRDHVEGNPNFPSPQPTMAVLSTDIGALDGAQIKVASGAKGATTLRNACMQTVVVDLFRLRNYVQSVAEQQASPALAAAVIESAFMSVKKQRRTGKADLQARNTTVSGKVVLSAKAVAQVATYYWQYSADQVTWIDLPETMRATTTMTGLTRAQTYAFRFRALTRGGETAWSEAVTLLVH